MKKIIITLISLLIINNASFAATTNSESFKKGVYLYKKGNYVGCMEQMTTLIAKDPGNAIARYYLAISYVQLGKKQEAIAQYNNIISLNSQSELARYAKIGLNQIAGITSTIPEVQTIPSIKQINTPINATTNIQNNNEAMTGNVQNVLNQRKIDSMVNQVNQNGTVDNQKMKQFEYFSKQKSDNSDPSKNDIKKALEILAKAGINTGNTQTTNPTDASAVAEMMKMNMLMNSMSGMNNLMGGMNNNSSNNMMPLMMMMQQQGNGSGNNKMDPKAMQDMLMTMFSPDMSSMGINDYNNNKD